MKRPPGDITPNLFDLPLDEPADEGDEGATAAVGGTPERPSEPSAPVEAGLGPRLLAAGADFFVHTGAMAGTLLGLNAMSIEPRLSFWPGLLALLLVFSFLYNVVALAFWGQTAGMAWFGLAARESPLLPLSFSQACRRWLGNVLTVVLLGAPALLAITGRSLSDRLSGTHTYQSIPSAPWGN